MDIIIIVKWWLALLLFGLIGWPLSYSLLRHLPYRGFAFARPVGILFSGYILWLGGTFRIVQNNLGGILIAMLVVFLTGLWWHKQQYHHEETPSIFAWLKKEWAYILSVEILFNVGFMAWVLFKSYNPNIETAGGEKWMEIAFINGTLRSPYFPPQDPWLSGFAISYYYFGYVLMAMITQLTGIVSTTAFNLYTPTIFAMTLTAAYGIGANLVGLHQQNSATPRKLFPVISTGLLSALLVGFLGNLIGVLEVIHKRGLLPDSFWIWLDIRDLKVPPVGLSESWIPDRFIWWWRGSRVLTDYNLMGNEQEVIDEFPFFSFMLGDVHPHVLGLPFVLLVVALALNLLASPIIARETLPLEDSESTIDKIRHFLQNSARWLLDAVGGRLAFGCYAIAIGGLSFLNTWDFPIYLGVISLSLLAWHSYQTPEWKEGIAPTIVGSVLLMLLSVIFYLPFYATFQSQAGGILPNLWNPTHFPQFFVFFGPFLIGILGLWWIMAGQQQAWRNNLNWSLPATMIAPVLVMIFALGLVMVSSNGRAYIDGILNNHDIQQAIGGGTLGTLVQTSMLRRVINPWTFLLVGGLLGGVIAMLVGFSQSYQTSPTRRFTTETFVLILACMGLILPLTVEFIFLRDNFGYRMNTVFKFYFQAWVLLALSTAFAFYYVSRVGRGVLVMVWQGVMALLIIGGLFYPILAIADKTNYLNNPQTLDGIAWVSQHRPGDYAAIQWLRENAPPDAVLVEAPGSGYASYQYTARVSALTGIPTLLGWGGHQSQWRGNYDEPGRREPDIDKLFRTVDPRQTLALLDKYGITYVYVGPLERERYTPDGLQKFGYIMDVVFEEADVIIYQRR